MKKWFPVMLVLLAICFSSCGPNTEEIAETSQTDNAIGSVSAQSTKPSSTQTPTIAPTAQTIEAPGLLAFASDQDGALGIYLMNADGSGDVVLLSIHPNYESWPAWSPSGEFIAFSSWRDDDAEIYLINADGSGLDRLTNSPGIDALPDWSPDSSQIAFESQRSGNSDIYVMNVNGSAITGLTQDPAADAHPSWSPDGDQIAFESDRDGDAEIFVISADGSNLIQLTENTYADGGPAWSPDGEHIAFLSDRDGNIEIYVMDIDGSNVTRLTNNPTEDLYPAWSPEGNYIAFTSVIDGNPELYVMNANGSGLTRMTNTPAFETYPTWSPPEMTLPQDPWFGAPWCMRDTDGDFDPDTPTNIFTTDDMFAYVMFPFRNMEDGTEWSHNWIPESGLSITNMGFWNHGERGFHIAYFSAPSWGSGVLTIQLVLEGDVVQEIECEVIEP